MIGAATLVLVFMLLLPGSTGREVAAQEWEDSLEAEILEQELEKAIGEGPVVNDIMQELESQDQPDLITVEQVLMDNREEAGLSDHEIKRIVLEMKDMRQEAEGGGTGGQGGGMQ